MKNRKQIMTDFYKKVLLVSRAEIGKTEFVDDQIAKEIIIKNAFGYSESDFFTGKEMESLVEKVFLKTRRRLGIINPLVEDSDVSEIMVNGPENIFVEKNGKLSKYDLSFDSVAELEDVIRNIAGDVHREINEMNPIVDARLPDGSRVNGVYKNIAVNGPILTIRKFSDKYLGLKELVLNKTMDEKTAEMLKILVYSGYNIFVSGGTSSGKTTLLNALSEAIPEGNRVIVIEDSMELKMHFIENIVRLETRNSNASGKGMITMAELIKTSLRMRPDRIVVGEVRGAEVVDMIQAMNTGHDGSLSTGHGNSVQGMLKRLESMYLMALPLNIDAIRSQISEGIDIMVHIEKQSDGTRKITEISELLPYNRKDFEVNTLLRINENGIQELTGNRIFNSRKARLKSKEYAQRLQNLGFIE